MSTKPRSKFFDCFSKWLTDKCKKAEDLYPSIKKDLSNKWDMAGADVSILQPNKIEDIFKRDDIQDACGTLLKGNGILSDSIVLRWQNAFIAADERAFRIRHLTPSRALVHGRAATLRWQSSYISDIVCESIKNAIDTSKKYYEHKQ